MVVLVLPPNAHAHAGHTAPHTTPSVLLFSLSSLWLSCHCDRNHSAGQTSPVCFLTLTGDWSCRQVSLISKPTFIKERTNKKRGNSKRFDRNLHPQQSLKPESWGDLLRFHFICSFFPPLPLSQNMWVIRAETFPLTHPGCLCVEVLLCLSACGRHPLKLLLL